MPTATSIPPALPGAADRERRERELRDELIAIEVARRIDRVPGHQRCPCCWPQSQGVGRRLGQWKLSDDRVRRTMRCRTCGAEWCLTLDDRADRGGNGRTEMTITNVVTPNKDEPADAVS